MSVDAEVHAMTIPGSNKTDCHDGASSEELVQSLANRGKGRDPINRVTTNDEQDCMHPA